MSIVRDKILAQYGDKMMRNSALRAGSAVFERLLSGEGYRTALEIGTYRGCAAAELSQYVERVITVDLRHGEIERGGGHFDREAFWKSLGVNNVDLLLVDDDAEKARAVAGLEFDFAFIDGAHDLTVRSDFALVKRCGHVLFHDAVDNHVHQLVRELPQEQVQMFGDFALWTA